ncbi:MAG: RtcB family protein [Candidatus Altiarchaeota archaeon]|nr:RtcB family protein [Candidatus Altiarchaeota archaeon]
MLVPGRIYGDEGIIGHLLQDVEKGKEWNALVQIVNVACLPGIQKASFAMSDVHPGYGFPIGGVGAFDTETGVISVAGVGFDVNCLSGDSKILHEHGYTKSIKEFKGDFYKQRIKSTNPTRKITDTSIEAFMQISPKKPVYEVETESGRKIVATADHPFFTFKGMVPLHELKDEAISVYPFEGVGYEKPSDDIIVSKEDILALPLKKDLTQTVEELDKRGLLPLKVNSDKLPYLLKLMGFVYGDGCMYFTKGKGSVWFYGDEADLEDIQEDIKKLGFKASKIYYRNRKHSIDTMYGTVRFRRVEKSIKTTSSSLVALLWALGVPIGNKTIQNYTLPKWFLRGTKWQKRLFLASFLGAELSAPKTVTGHYYNFCEPILSMNKREKNVKSGEMFLRQIKSLLGEFEVKSKIIGKRLEYKNKKDEISIRLRLQISSSPENLIMLWGRVGFEYNRRKRALACAAIQYLRIKNKAIKMRENSIKEALRLRKLDYAPSKIYELVVGEYVNRRFVERTLFEGRKTSSRIASNFIKFKDFLKTTTHGLGQTGQVWDKIVSKKKIEFKDYVYDFAVTSKFHNFIANCFVVSNCGVRTLRTNLEKKDIEKNKERVADTLFKVIPAGLGSTGDIRLSVDQIDEVLVKGAEYAVNTGYGFKEDLEYTEENGKVANARPENVSREAKQRQFKQVGTLGSGNHYLEVQYVEQIFDEEVAKAYGLFKDQVLVSIHCGSRALGHQIGTDYLKTLEAASKKYGIPIRERELVCAPFKSEEGQKYFTAVNCGINCAFANRQALTQLTRRGLEQAIGIDEKEVKVLYDIGHNTAKLERHDVDGKEKELIVLRKGSTRAFGPGVDGVPKAYKKVGQPVLVGGTMGTASYILHGTEKGMKDTFGSACHGAGRRMSREQAKREWRGDRVVQELAKRGIIIKGHSPAGVAEEAPGAYKDVTEVVDVMHNSGIARKVAFLRPMISIKG